MSAALDMTEREFLEGELGYHDAGYNVHEPTQPQHIGLLLPHREVLYGGAAGGGKTDWLLMSALQYVDVPGYAALILRKTSTQLNLPGAIVPRSKEWLSGTDAEWSEKRLQWTFPSGAVLKFGHLQHENDKYDYQGAEVHFVGFDELTQFTESQYRYLFSRTRRPDIEGVEASNIPIRFRAGSNPGGIGHDWVKQRFLTDRKASRRFMPAKLQDNPYLDHDEYVESLNELDPVTRKQLLEGDWTARASGGYFKREWVDFCDAAPADAEQCRGWDLAATKAKPGADPDWTVGAKVSEKDGHYFVGPLLRDRYSPNGLDKALVATAHMDGQPCKIRIEQEPGSSGKIATAHFVKLLAGFDVRGKSATGSKLSRFGPFASQCEAGNVTFVNGPWVGDCIDELEALQADDSHAHDDQADAISIAFNDLAGGGMSIEDSMAMMRSAA